jgi:T4 RnlA family RNA ligase
MTLHYEFPHDITLDEVKTIVANNSNFILVDKGNYSVANYIRAGNDVHVSVEDRDSAILRELRGLIFCNTTGQVISRRFQKFFNYGEREDVMTLDLSQPHVILDKLDGSMITPFKINGKIIWGSKMGETDLTKQIDEFMSNDYDLNNNYHSIYNYCEYNNLTPIFEWTSRQQRIVVDYPEDKLTLIAIRDNITGKYYNYNNMKYIADFFVIPIVNQFSYTGDNFNDILNYVKNMQEGEGIVIRFDDGHMVKIKADLYVTLHRAKSLIENERDVMELVLNEKVDDLYPLLYKEDAQKLHNYYKDVWDQIIDFVSLTQKLINNTSHMTRKEFAFHTTNIGSGMRSIAFSCFDKKRVDIGNVTEYLLKNLGSNSRFERNREIVATKWNYKNTSE